jgi:hypothetical protein
VSRQNERTTARDITTGEGIIRAVGQSLLDVNRSGHTDGVQCLPLFFQKVVRVGAIILRNVPLPQVIKLFLNCRGVATTFYATLVSPRYCLADKRVLSP